jgi:hypothetical protein
MDRWLRWLASLGNAGACANARASLDARHREDLLVGALVSRLDELAPPVTPETPAASARAAA